MPRLLEGRQGPPPCHHQRAPCLPQGVPRTLACRPQEGLTSRIIGLGRDPRGPADPFLFERGVLPRNQAEPAARAPQKGLISWLVVAAPRGTTPRRSR